MQTSPASPRKWPVNLTINEALVAQAKAYTDNLPATVESLLAEFVTVQQNARRNRQRDADACAADWNAVHASIGSFADEHSPLYWRNSTSTATRGPCAIQSPSWWRSSRHSLTATADALDELLTRSWG